jgi:hypothetical protein
MQGHVLAWRVMGAMLKLSRNCASEELEASRHAPTLLAFLLTAVSVGAQGEGNDRGRCDMKCSRYAGSRLSLFVLLAFGGSAHATINMTGRWVIRQPGGPVVVDFMQVGTALTMTPAFTQPGSATGTIDSTTGAFTIADPCLASPFSLEPLATSAGSSAR